MTKKPSKRTTADVACGSLPPRMRVLYVASRHRTGAWLTEAFASDSASEVLLEEATGGAAGVARLRDETFDAVLVSHEPGQLDAIELVEGLRGGGAEEPILVLGDQSEPELAALAYEVGADAYICVHTTTTRTLIWQVSRAVERHQLIQENRRLGQAERQRLRLERNEAERLVDAQRTLAREVARFARGDDDAPIAPANNEQLPPNLVVHYRELLRASIIMGSGNLSTDLAALADLLATAGVTAAQALELHVRAQEEVLAGLGSRSSRHVMNRADLLALEVALHLAEGYRRRYEQHVPAHQRWLPGFAA